MRQAIEMNKAEELKEISYGKVNVLPNIAMLLGCFILLNAVKLSLFNFMIVPSKTFEVFTYKMWYTLLANLIIYTLFFKIRSRIPFLLLYIIQEIYTFAYLSYFSYFNSYLHLFQASALFTEGVGPIKHFTIPVEPHMLLIFIDLPVFIGLMVHYPRIRSFNQSVKGKVRYLLAVPAIILCALEGFNYYHNYSIVHMNEDFFRSEPQIVERYGTIANNISDIAVNYGGESILKHFQYGKTISAFAGNSQRPNIVAIQVESMDANIVNMEYKGKNITPYLHSLTENSIYYPYTLSYHLAGGTSDSEFSVLNSLEPLSNYPSFKIPKYDYPNSLVKIFNEGNYHTMAFHGNAGNFYNREVAYPKMGFREFNDIDKMKLEEEGWGAPDHAVFEYAFNKMKNQEEPFFSYIVTMSSHMPFTNVETYYNNSDYDDISDDTVKNYFNSFSYLDTAIKDFVEEVKANCPNTYIFIWGDHTPDILTPEYRQASYISDSKYFEFVPMFVITPDKKVYQENRYAASFLDVAPTMLYAAGLKYSIKSDGMNLIESPSDKPKIPFRDDMYDRAELYERGRQGTEVED